MKLSLNNRHFYAFLPSDLTKLMRCVPSDLQVKFENSRFRFTGVGGETITTKVALIALGVHPA